MRSDLNPTIDFSFVPDEAPNAPVSPMIVSRFDFLLSSFTIAN